MSEVPRKEFKKERCNVLLLRLKRWEQSFWTLDLVVPISSNNGRPLSLSLFAYSFFIMEHHLFAVLSHARTKPCVRKLFKKYECANLYPDYAYFIYATSS